jgi:NTP pyrophosphatase (non-canonical NTP hydrolase)
MDTKDINYAEMVKALAKDGQDIIDSLTGDKADLWHMATGVSGEAGELLDAIKKHVIYNKPIDRANIVEELGDLRFYMQGIMNNLNITEEEIIEGNKAKLSVRYNGLKYSDQAAQDRADKQE